MRDINDVPQWLPGMQLFALLHLAQRPDVRKVLAELKRRGD